MLQVNFVLHSAQILGGEDHFAADKIAKKAEELGDRRDRNRAEAKAQLERIRDQHMLHSFLQGWKLLCCSKSQQISQCNEQNRLLIGCSLLFSQSGGRTYSLTLLLTLTTTQKFPLQDCEELHDWMQERHVLVQNDTYRWDGFFGLLFFFCDSKHWMVNYSTCEFETLGDNLLKLNFYLLT